MSPEIREIPSVEMDRYRAPFSPALAQAFVQDRLSTTSLTAHRYSHGISYTCSDSVAFRLDNQQVTLLLLYVKPDVLLEDSSETLEFVYHLAHDPEKGRSSKDALASMQLRVIDHDTFELKHRYVQPEYRRSHLHIGSRLAQTAEAWLKQVASALERPVTIRLSTGQESVIRWAQKQGYSLTSEDQDILHEIDQHPERFVQDTAHISYESKMLNIQKDLYLFPKEIPERYMENAVRLHFVKVISP